MNKYHAKRTAFDGMVYHSKKEADYAADLTLARKSGELRFFLRQVPFHLPGGVVYRCDFMEVWADGNVRFVDVKGYMTNESKIKIKLTEAFYPVKILLT